MKVIRLEPQGYCNGVKNALATAYNALASSSYPRPIYLLGSIIHNQIVINDFIKKGAILLEKEGASKEELLDTISKGTIIISAHGVSDAIYTKAKQKGLEIIDTTCGKVKLIQKQMREPLLEGYTCLYVGTKRHPECEGILGISSSIQLIESVADVSRLKLNADKIYVSNQTTLSIYETEKIYALLKEKFPQAKIENSICNATTIRQMACYNQALVDLCLVIGDKKSSNTKKLAIASESVGIYTILVESLDQVKQLDFSKIKTISVTSGASTPPSIVEEIIEYLKRVD